MDYKLPIGEGKSKNLSFSMNFVHLLQELTGKDLVTWGTEVDKLTEEQQGRALCDVVLCALKAYDLEEGNDVDYNIYKVIKWVGQTTEAEKTELIKALQFSTTPPVEQGK